MEIRLYKKFVKRSDSTKLPVNDSYVTKNVRLKEGTSIQNPTFLLSDYDEAYNYVYVPRWGRYYFRNDCMLNINGVFELSLTFDHLASYKASIGAYTCYVERCSSQFDRLINDPMLSQKQYVVHESRTSTEFTDSQGGAAFNTAGCYILRTKAKNANSETGINTYALTKSQLGLFLNDVFSPETYDDVFIDAADEVLKSMFDPMEYVISVCWVPITATKIAACDINDDEAIKCGWWTVGATGYRMRASAFSFSKEIELPNSYFNDWRDYNPLFTKCTMRIPCVGLVDFDPMQLCYPDDTSVRLKIIYSIDCTTGEGEVILTQIRDGIDVEISNYKAHTCCNIQIAQTTFSLTGAVADTITAIGGAMSGNIPMAVLSGVSAISNVLQPQSSTVGINGSKTSINNFLKLWVYIQHYGSCEYPSTKGRPLCKNVLLGSLSGYIQCAGASIDNIAGSITDKELVNASLNNGFYYE